MEKKRGKRVEGESKRMRGEEGSRAGGQHKWLEGDWRDDWQLEVIEREGERTTAGGAGGRKNEMTLPSYFFFLTFSPSPSFSLTHPSISVLHSAASQAGLAELPRSSLLTPSTLKVISTKLALYKCKNIKLLYIWLLVSVVGGVFCVHSGTIPLFLCVSVHVLSKILDASSPHRY